jgi:hypothetical protein
VCRVQRSLDNEQLEIVWWEKSEVAPPLCPVTYGNLHRCKVEELFEGDVGSINHRDVIDIAFVFFSRSSGAVLGGHCRYDECLFHSGGE